MIMSPAPRTPLQVEERLPPSLFASMKNLLSLLSIFFAPLAKPLHLRLTRAPNKFALTFKAFHPFCHSAHGVDAFVIRPLLSLRSNIPLSLLMISLLNS